MNIISLQNNYDFVDIALHNTINLGMAYITGLYPGCIYFLQDLRRCDILLLVHCNSYKNDV